MYSRNRYVYTCEGRSMPFYVLLRVFIKMRIVPEWKMYANFCVKKSTAKLIEDAFFLWNKRTNVIMRMLFIGEC